MSEPIRQAAEVETREWLDSLEYVLAASGPERVIEQLKQVEERYPGLDRVGVSHPVGTPQSIILEQLEWFAKDVLPAFKGKVENPVPAD